MILDRIKLRTQNRYLIAQKAAFDQKFNKRTGKLLGESYNSKTDSEVPFNLYVGIDYVKQTLTLEFSSKILKDDYWQLINKNNIRQCLETINTLNVCTIDVDSILNDAEVVSMDATCDVEYDLSDGLLTALNQCVSNYRRYKWEHYEGCGIRFSADVVDKRDGDSLILYDKAKEMVKESNRSFLRSVSAPNQIIDHFDNKVRCEVNLKNQDMIRAYLGITNTRLEAVLNAEANPILVGFDKIFNPQAIAELSTKAIDGITTSNQRTILSVVKEFQGDVKLIEQEFRPYKKQYRTRTKFMQEVEQVLTVYLNRQPQLIEEFRDKIKDFKPSWVS